MSETWVAMMAQIQAERVETPELRALFTTIPQARSAEHLACLKT